MLRCFVSHPLSHSLCSFPRCSRSCCSRCSWLISLTHQNRVQFMTQSNCPTRAAAPTNEENLPIRVCACNHPRSLLTSTLQQNDWCSYAILLPASCQPPNNHQHPRRLGQAGFISAQRSLHPPVYQVGIVTHKSAAEHATKRSRVQRRDNSKDGCEQHWFGLCYGCRFQSPAAAASEPRNTG